MRVVATVSAVLIVGLGSSAKATVNQTTIDRSYPVLIAYIAKTAMYAPPASLMNGKAGLSGDMTLRIEKAFGVKMDALMRMQASYDIAQTRKREKQIQVRRIHQLAGIHA